MYYHHCSISITFPLVTSKALNLACITYYQTSGVAIQIEGVGRQLPPGSENGKFGNLPSGENDTQLQCGFPS